MEVKNKEIYNYMNGTKLEIEKVMKDYTNYVYTILNKCSVNLSEEDMEEVNLDVFLTLWKNQEKLNINNSISAYIGGITKNLIKQKYRYIKENDNILDYEEELISNSNIELIFSNDEQNIIIASELEKMKIQDKDIFILYYYENKNVKEVSVIHNISESKVKTKLFRIRKKLQKALKERGYDYNE